VAPTDRRAPISERAPGTPPEIAAVVERLLAMDRKHRYASAKEALAALTAWKGFPTDGVSELARWLARVLPRVAQEGQDRARASRLAAWPSRRTLRRLGVVAAVAVTAAVTAWAIPRPSRPAKRAPMPVAMHDAALLASPPPIDAGVALALPAAADAAPAQRPPKKKSPSPSWGVVRPSRRLPGEAPKE
jgi:hypothetical protein